MLKHIYFYCFYEGERLSNRKATESNYKDESQILQSVPNRFSLLSKNNSGPIWPRNLVYILMERRKMWLISWIKMFQNLVSTLKQGAPEYRTQNQMQIFCMINALKIFK